jgi:hypothetical protein
VTGFSGRGRFVPREILVKRDYTDLMSAGKDWSAKDRRPSSVV